MTENRPHLTALAHTLPSTVPFVGPEAHERERGEDFRARLGANESGFGPSPRVVEAMATLAPEMWKYCDSESFDLKEAIAGELDIAANNIVVGEGIDGLLGLAVRLFLEVGQPVVTSLGAYPTFNYHVAGFGGRLVTVPYRDDKEDLEALAATVRQENAPLVYLANPDNPMGSWWEAGEIERFIEELPPTTMLILDEAYSETAPPSAIPAIDCARPNVLRMRTFSKVYGLAGLRCGYAVGEHAMIAAFDKIRNHFGVSRMAQVAALAAFSDKAHLAEIIDRVANSRNRLTAIAEKNGLKALPSAANFVTIDCGDDGTFALAVMQEMLARGIFVRKPMAPGIDRCIRVSVAPDDEIDLFEEALPAILDAVRNQTM